MFLYAPYSRKLGRRAYFYTHDGYQLWLRLEADPNIFRFNERVPKRSIPVTSHLTKEVAPDAVSLNANGRSAIHIIQRNVESEAPKVDWAGWAIANDLEFISWTPELLRGKGPYMDNLAQLLRFISRPRRFSDPVLERKVKEELALCRKSTIATLQRQLPAAGPEAVLEVVATLMVDREVFSDIDRYPLSLLTELSLHSGVFNACALPPNYA